MRTGLVRKYGERDTVQEYIDVAVKHHGCSKRVHDTALKMYTHIAQKTTFSGRYPSMLAMALVNLAAMEKNQDIPSKAWSGDCTCAYKTLLKHSKELRRKLEKEYDFPNLKYHQIGK